MHRVVAVVLLVAASFACAKPMPPDPGPSPFEFERVNELERAMVERIWSQIDDPVSPENAVENYARAQAFLHTLTSRPATRSGAVHPAVLGRGPVTSPLMEQRLGPAYTTELYQRALAWRERNKPALMERLQLSEREVDRVLNGAFRVGDPWEYAVIAWGSPNRVNRDPARSGAGLELLYANGKLRRVLVADGVVARVVD